MKWFFFNMPWWRRMLLVVDEFLSRFKNGMDVKFWNYEKLIIESKGCWEMNRPNLSEFRKFPMLGRSVERPRTPASLVSYGWRQTVSDRRPYSKRAIQEWAFQTLDSNVGRKKSKSHKTSFLFTLPNMVVFQTGKDNASHLQTLGGSSLCNCNLRGYFHIQNTLMLIEKTIILNDTGNPLVGGRARTNSEPVLTENY